MTDKLVHPAAMMLTGPSTQPSGHTSSYCCARLPVLAAQPSSLTGNPIPATDAKKPFDISNLMSPPEPAPLDCFNQGVRRTDPSTTMSAIETHKVPLPPPSPPISPYTKVDHGETPEHAPHRVLGNADPILYPIADMASSPVALFTAYDDPSRGQHSDSPRASGSAVALAAVPPARVQAEPGRVVDGHIAARPTEFFCKIPPPKREDYELCLYFQSDVLSQYAANPRGWLRQERQILRADRRSAMHVRPLLPAKTASRPVNTKMSPRGNRVVKLKERKRPSSPTGHTFRVSSLAPNGRANLPKHASPTPEPRTRIVAPNREDKDFMSLPDFCPPVLSLPSRPQCLKVDWKGTPLDLSSDPHRSLLHPEEVALAACLRLDCATYLTSKRRVFVRRLECAKIGKEFRKTDAQQACKIDVNKASKLWTAYDRVGWLNIEWMQPFLC